MATEPWLRLLRAAAGQRQPWHDLLATHGSAAAVAGLPASVLSAAGVSASAIASLNDAHVDADDPWRRWLESPRRRLIGLDDATYPPLLRGLPDPPLALWIEGDASSLLAAPQLAIVGSRNPTRDGRETARQFARYLSDRGLTITSGLAVGIDAASHEGGLAGASGTIAVLGSGLDTIYPADNLKLAERIVGNGLLMSEFPPGAPPRAAHFPQRNRIIAGMSVGTLVVEAARRSGSLITARLAGQYGREVFAVPGSIHNPLAKGCHELIRQGAKLVDDVADIIVELAPLLSANLTAGATSTTDAPSAAATSEPSLTEQPAYAALLDALGFAPTGIGELARRTGLTAAELSSMLLVLEFEGLVEALPGGRYARLSQRD
jgi:DNA processing protein